VQDFQIPPSPLVGSPEFVEKSTVPGLFMSEAFWLLLVTFWLHFTPLRRVSSEEAGYFSGKEKNCIAFSYSL